MRKPLDNYLVIQHTTPVIDHLFNDYDLTHQFQSIYTFIDKKKDWPTVLIQLKPIIEKFALNYPERSTDDVIDFFDQLLMQMIRCKRFKDQIGVMHSAIYELLDTQTINITVLFKLALVFDDGHGLRKLVMRKRKLVLTKKTI